jgi:hypothetical protein
LLLEGIPHVMVWLDAFFKGLSMSGEIADPLDQIVEIAAELLKGEPGTEQPPERIG